MSIRIDELIEDHLRRNTGPRDLFIPGLDDGGKIGSARENEIFDLAPDVISSPIYIKDFKAPHAKGEDIISGDVGNMQAFFNMVKVFVGIGILATPSSFKLIGIVGGAAGMVFIGAIATYTMKL